MVNANSSFVIYIYHSSFIISCFIMKLISENIIDLVAEKLDEGSDAAYDKACEEFSKQQPAVFSYLFSEDIALLTEDEREYLLYLALIIWKSVVKATAKSGKKVPVVTALRIDQAEEDNWALLEPVKSKRFSDKADVFFKNYPQEDLLAFVEDMLTDDENTDVTKEGREPMFVALKTIIDVFCV
jgi:hypothetical protein